MAMRSVTKPLLAAWDGALSSRDADALSRGYAILALAHAWTSLSVPLGAGEALVLAGNRLPPWLSLDWLEATRWLATSGFLALIAFPRATRFALPLGFAWHLLLHHLFRGTGWQVDAWLAVMALSLAFVFRGSGGERDPAPAPGMRFLRFELAWLYLASGAGKLGSPDWRSGGALGRFLASDLGPGRTPDEFWLVPLSVAIAVAEVALSGLVLFRSAKKPTLVLALLLHVPLFFLTPVRVFSAALLWCHAALFREIRVRERPSEKVPRRRPIHIGATASP